MKAPFVGVKLPTSMMWNWKINTVHRNHASIESITTFEPVFPLYLKYLKETAIIIIITH
jgi:hypothetical protein